MLINIDDFYFDTSKIKMITPIKYNVYAIRSNKNHIEVKLEFNVVLEDRTFVFRHNYIDEHLYDVAFCEDKKDEFKNKIYIDFDVYDLKDAKNINYLVNNHIKNNFSDSIDFIEIKRLLTEITLCMMRKDNTDFVVPYFELSEFSSTKSSMIKY